MPTRRTLYEEPALWVVGWTMPTFWRPSTATVRIGDRVEKGGVIGLIGKTGRATGPHLCWRLNWFQERLDPQLAAPPMPS